MSLDLPDLLDVLTSYQVDDRVIASVAPPDKDGNAALFSRGRVKDDLDSNATAQAVPKSIDDEDPETWGTAPEQQAAQRAVMAMAGPPAPTRTQA